MDNNFNRGRINTRKENKQIRLYFETCSDSINEYNLYTLRKVCMYIAWIYVFLLILARLILVDFTITPAYVLVVPLLVVYYFINLKVRKMESLSTTATSIICLSFYFCLELVFLGMDIFSFPEYQAMWFPVLLLIFPNFYIDKMYKYGFEELFALSLFLFLSYHFKPYEIFILDAYRCTACYIVSMLCAHIILGVRSHEGLAREELTRINKIDKLTLILNKGALLNSIDSYYSRKPIHESVALCVIDVDNFKQVNDTLGHDSGDKLLAHIGDLLRANFRSVDIIGRFGGDEFVVLMPGVSNKSIVEMRCRSIQMFLTDYAFEENTRFSLSIGAILDHSNLPYSKLFKLADDALYESKVIGKNCCTTWEIKNRDLSEKPLMIFVTGESSEEANILMNAEKDNFEIIKCDNGSKALSLISLYSERISIAIIEMDAENISIVNLLTYLKGRAGFEHIPVLAIAQTESSFDKATELGANHVLYTNSGTEKFKHAISSIALTADDIDFSDK